MTIETKYNHYDTVWFMYQNKPVSRTVVEFSAICRYNGGTGDGWGSKAFPIAVSYPFTMDNSKTITLQEYQLFPTKEALLKSL